MKCPVCNQDLEINLSDFKEDFYYDCGHCFSSLFFQGGECQVLKEGSLDQSEEAEALKESDEEAEALKEDISVLPDEEAESLKKDISVLPDEEAEDLDETRIYRSALNFLLWRSQPKNLRSLI